MLINYSWLKELLEVPQVNELEPIFAQMGLPVENIECIKGPKEAILSNIKEVKSLTDEFYLIKIFTGEKDFQIVSKARNAKYLTTNDMLAVFLPGVIFNGTEYSEKTLAGELSQGMAASAKELGIGSDNSGLMIFDKSFEAGTTLDHWQDYVLEIEITPNRADTLSVYGIVRDLAAFLKLPFKDFILKKSSSTQSDIDFSVILPNNPIILKRDHKQEKRLGCEYAIFAEFENMPQKTPAWIAKKLILSGIELHNFSIDLGNYIMLEMGQPIAVYGNYGKNIKIDFASGQKFIDLSEKEYTLSEEDLCIFDETQILSLAGVIGSNSAKVVDQDKIMFEAAAFDSVLLRRSSARHNIKTDSVYRFERGVDPELPIKAFQRFAEIAIEQGAKLTNFQEVGKPPNKQIIDFDINKINKLLGIEIKKDIAINILKSLGVEIENDKAIIPSWRMDLKIWQDLAEEIIRIYGFDQIPQTLPSFLSKKNLKATFESEQNQEIRKTLSAMGFRELVTYTFTNEQFLEKVKAKKPVVFLQNPQNQDRTVMRTELYPSLLKTLVENYDKESALFFEIAKVFNEQETNKLALLMKGDFVSSSYNKNFKSDFYLFKALLEKFANTFRAKIDITSKNVDLHPSLHPGISGQVFWNNRNIGFIGALHPLVKDSLNIKEDVYICEFNLPLLSEKFEFIDPSKAPIALRDLAIVAPKNIEYGEIVKILQHPLMKHIEPFDIFESEKIGLESKSIAVRMVYQDEKTLSDEQIDKVFQSQIKAIKDFGFEIREK